MKEFELIFSERDIEKKLDDLDEIIHVAQHRKDNKVELPANLDKLSPSEIIEATILSGSDESLENLNMIYNQLCVDNAELYQELEELGRVSEEIKGDIDSLLGVLKREVEILGKDLKLDDLISELGPI
ncbi:Nnf1-domain-containing protein [Suhomyces tanzawaensis NRRL Y-17324]|uniref:Nnf1-domain-containing protein n=1 Tax=Suhomyces tanzawaensis NRRL Y-17324 TaxID=984487 RepID=A0A1E4SK48_9ASCO|nr:Nnf1-domain-containing protein [Suhomyces tanzawaensis NRRL Y-17324]ODV79881.1 Nnf1-domain-containing protein [Suhomyces tanzawaensis NRRL Y-17324]